MARCAGLHHFEERLANAHVLSALQFRDCNAASRDVFLSTPRRDIEFFERLKIRDEHLPAATAVQAVPESLIFDSKDFFDSRTGSQCAID